MNKQEQYAVLIVGQLNEMFKDGCENYINPSDFDDDKNSTAFFHALANLAPSFIYGTLTGDETSALGFNHIANRLCFQFSELDKA